MWMNDNHHLSIMENPHKNAHKKMSGLVLFLVIVDGNVLRKIKKSSFAIVFLCSLLIPRTKCHIWP